MQEETDVAAEQQVVVVVVVKSVAGNAIEALFRHRLPPAVTRDWKRTDELHVARGIYLMIVKIEGGEIESGT